MSILNRIILWYNGKMKKLLLFSLLFGVIFTCCACGNVSIPKAGTGISTKVENKDYNELSKVGEMVKPRISPKVIALNDKQLLIVGGYQKFEIKPQKSKINREAQYSKENIYELSAELYDIETNKSQLLNSKPFFYPIIEAIKLSNGNILFLGGEKPQLFDVKANKFKKIDNIFNDNYTSPNTRFIELNNDKGMFCSIYTRIPDEIKCFLVNTDNFKLINEFQIPPFDNRMFKYSKILRLGTDKFLVFTTLRTFNSPNREVYISEYSISDEKFVKHTKIEDIGNELCVNTINDDLVLISGARIWGYGLIDNPTLSIYSVLKEKKIKTFNVDKFLWFYEKDGKLESSEYILNPKTFELEQNKEYIDWKKYNLPEKSTRFSLKNNRYLIFGGKSEDGKPLNKVYVMNLSTINLPHPSGKN